MATARDLLGLTFGQRTVVERVSTKPSVWRYVCVCGNTGVGGTRELNRLGRCKKCQWGEIAPTVESVCGACDKPFVARFNLKRGRYGTFCSRECFVLGMRGPNNYGWKGGRRVNPYGYVSVVVDGKRRLEHRVVMERVLGRPLETREHVHHINGIKHDNRPENLQVLDKIAHHKLHGRPRGAEAWVQKTCGVCGEPIKKRAKTLSPVEYCSRQCAGVSRRKAWKDGDHATL